MSANIPTQPRELWINQNGRVVCISHGGTYLQYAEAGGCLESNIFTPLDRWMRTKESDCILCEDCGETGSQAWVAAQDYIPPVIVEIP